MERTQYWLSVPRDGSPVVKAVAATLGFLRLFFGFRPYPLQGLQMNYSEGVQGK
jgi:hypothetical protein